MKKIRLNRWTNK